MQLKTKRKNLSAVIISNLLILSLLTLSACTEGANADTENSAAESSSAAEISSAAETDSPDSAAVTETAAAENKDTLLPEEIEACIEELSDGVEVEGFEYDIDFDGNKELLCPVYGELKIFKKSENVISEKTAGEDGVHYVSAEDLKTLQTYEDEGGKYSYFYYKYDSGSMKCNVLTAIKCGGGDVYTVENIASWGRLEFEGDASQYNRPFFRKGWSSLERGTEESESDISQEEFLEIYNKYENLPAWDEYLA